MRKRLLIGVLAVFLAIDILKFATGSRLGLEIDCALVLIAFAVCLLVRIKKK